MASIFEQTIVPKLNFSNFALNEEQIVTCYFGQLIPVYIREVLPNDVFTLSAFADIQFAPMIAPMMQDVHASIHFFYSPDRILWDGFETFITGSEDGNPVSEEELPVQAGLTLQEIHDILQNDSLDSAQGTLLDYFGLPNNLAAAPGTDVDDLIISDIPLRAYFKIWYDYYRDENLQVDFYSEEAGARVKYFDFWRTWRSNSDPASTDSWEEGIRRFSPFYRSFRKDYFTAALPSPQKGEAVTLNLGGSAPVNLADNTPSINGNKYIGYGFPQGVDQQLIAKWNGSVQGDQDPLAIGRYGLGPDTTTSDITQDSSDYNYIKSFYGNLFNPADPTTTGLVADLSKASAITVEALREAFAVQEILESLSMRGSRFTEFLKGNFGVTPDDYRLQRPQFLGGLVSPVQVQQIIQQAGVDTESGQLTAYAAGRAYAAAGERVFRTRFKEHGYIIGIMSVMPKAYYYQGIPRHFLRKDRFDYYMPQTAHLGEQGIMNMELFYDPQGIRNEGVFGFIPRWAEYKTSTSGIHGDFRGNLNYYHMGRVFSALPTLSEQFITTANLQTRPWATWKTSRPEINHLIWANLFFKVTASRPMPYQSIPKVM